MVKYIILAACVAAIYSFVSAQPNTQIPPAFSVVMEVIRPNEKNIHYRKIKLDRDRRIMSMDTSLPKTVDDIGTVIEKSEIDIMDMNVNTLHVENKTTTDCEVFHTNSDIVGKFYDIWYGILRDLYHLENGNHKYLGSAKIRGRSVDADVFRRSQNIQDPITNRITNTTFTWFLLDQQWTEVGSGDGNRGHRRPLMVQVSMNNQVDPPTNYTVSHYDWSFRKPYLNEYSISNCYGTKFRKQVDITFTSSRTLSRKLKIAESDVIAQSIAKTIGVSMLRISKNEISQNGNTVKFSTTLLADAFEIRKSESFKEKGKLLNDAFNDLLNMAKNGQIRVPSVAGVTLTSTGAQEVVPPVNNRQYGPGAMAGLAIGMLVLGVLIALAVGGLLIYKKTGENPMLLIKPKNAET